MIEGLGRHLRYFAEHLNIVVTSTPFFRQHACIFSRIIPIPPTTIASAMPTATVPRTAIRAFSRVRPSVNSRTAQRVATARPTQRCLHQTSSLASLASIRPRPNPSSLSARNATRFGVVESRRTMFIQTENTPNPDVCFLPAPYHSFHFNMSKSRSMGNSTNSVPGHEIQSQHPRPP